MENIKLLYESQEAVIRLFNNYSSIASKALYKSNFGKSLKTLTPEKMIQRLPIHLIIGNISENLLNEVRKAIYSLYRAKEITKNIYNNIMDSINL